VQIWAGGSTYACSSGNFSVPRPSGEGNFTGTKNFTSNISYACPTGVIDRIDVVVDQGYGLGEVRHTGYCSGGTPGSTCEWANPAPTGATLVTTAECTSVSSGNITTVTDTSPAYASDAAPPSMPAVSCPSGTVMTNWDVVRELPNIDPLTIASMPNAPLTISTSDPLIDNLGNGAELELQKNDGNGNWLPCTVALCADWYWQPEVQTEAEGGPTQDTYRCAYGTAVASISDCEMYWDPAADLPDGSVDSDITTETDRLTIEGDPAEQPVEADSGCTSLGSWLNPFAGMAEAVSCGLEWALVPSTSTQTQLDTIGATLQTKAPFGVVTGAAGFVGDVGDLGQTCWTEDLTMPGYESINVIDTCNGAGVWAWFRAQRPLMATVLYGSFVISLAWWGWKAYAPGTIQGG